MSASRSARIPAATSPARSGPASSSSDEPQIIFRDMIFEAIPGGQGSGVRREIDDQEEVEIFAMLLFQRAKPGAVRQPKGIFGNGRARVQFIHEDREQDLREFFFKKAQSRAQLLDLGQRHSARAIRQVAGMPRHHPELHVETLERELAGGTASGGGRERGRARRALHLDDGIACGLDFTLSRRLIPTYKTTARDLHPT